LQNWGMAEDLVLSLPQARRLAVRSQHLAGPPPRTGIDGMRRVLRGCCFGQLLRPGVVRRILSTGESAGRSRRVQAR
jgi:hypothetical protein